MDEAGRHFIEGVRRFAIEQPLPDGLDVAALRAND
jgi:hypothetical protein